jgi:hypothetical protein
MDKENSSTRMEECMMVIVDFIKGTGSTTKWMALANFTINLAELLTKVIGLMINFKDMVIVNLFRKTL